MCLNVRLKTPTHARTSLRTSTRLHLTRRNCGGSELVDRHRLPTQDLMWIIILETVSVCMCVERVCSVPVRHNYSDLTVQTNNTEPIVDHTTGN